MNPAPVIVLGVIAIGGVALLVWLQRRAATRNPRGSASARYLWRVLAVAAGVLLILWGPGVFNR